MEQSNYLTLFDIIIGIYAMLIFQSFFIVYTFIKSIYNFRLLSKKRIWTEIIEEEILKRIFEEQNNNDLIHVNNLKSNQYKQLFIDKIKSALVSFHGKSKDQIINLISLYNFDQYLLKKLEAKNPYKIAQAIQEVTAMELEIALPKIKELINHPNPIVKEEAQYSLIKFLKFDGLEIINNTNYKLSEWQQIRLLSALTLEQGIIQDYTLTDNQRFTEQQLDKIIEWLNSSNESIIIFTLKFIRKFQILELEKYLFNLLTTNNRKVVIQTIKTFTGINSLDIITPFIEFYPNQELEIQLELLKTLESRNLSSQKTFLITEALDNPNISIKKNAVRVFLKNINSSEETHQLFDENRFNEAEMKIILLEVAHKLKAELNRKLNQEQITILNQVILEYK